jgi:hypothetical protein
MPCKCPSIPSTGISARITVLCSNGAAASHHCMPMPSLTQHLRLCLHPGGASLSFRSSFGLIIDSRVVIRSAVFRTGFLALREKPLSVLCCAVAEIPSYRIDSTYHSPPIP